MQHVLFPTDFSDNTELALKTLLELVGEAHPTVTVVHVQEGSEDTAKAETALDDIAQRLRSFRHTGLSAPPPRMPRLSGSR